mgnify:CR=1 FL=1
MSRTSHKDLPAGSFKNSVQRDLLFWCGFGDINALIDLAAKRGNEAPIAVSMIYNSPPFTIVVKADSPIRSPKDLEGKKVGVRAYSVTTGVWTRGILANEYGVDNNKITWVVDDEEHVQQLKLPSNVIHTQGKSLFQMMKDGELAAGFRGLRGRAAVGRHLPGNLLDNPLKLSFCELLAANRQYDAVSAGCGLLSPNHQGSCQNTGQQEEISHKQQDSRRYNG